MTKFFGCAECGKKRKIVKETNDHGIYELELSCGHKTVDIKKSENIDIIWEPFFMAETALKQGDYFSAITYACAILEGYGKQLLEKEFRKRRLEIGNRTITNFSLHTVIIMLYSMRLIRKQEFLTLMAVKKYRNEFVHKGKAMFLPTKFIVKVEPTMKAALNCLRGIMKKLGAYRVD